MKRRAIVDVECYKNYFLISFLSVTTNKYKEFELYEGNSLDRESVKQIMSKFTTVNFNGMGLFHQLTQYRLKDYRKESLKLLIWWSINNEYKRDCKKCNK